MTRIGIRVDANETIATGHVMRCFSIADALKKMGEIPVFITADNFPKAWIEQNGYEVVSLQADWRYMEGELEELKQVIKEYSIEVLLVDSYFVTKIWFEKLQGLVKIMYMDDLGEQVYDANAVVCYAGYYRELALEEKYQSGVKFLLGMDYTPLRAVFSKLPPKRISGQIKELMVLSGGTDRYGFLWEFSERILESPFFETLEAIHIICGKYYEDYEKLLREFSANGKFHFHKAVKNIEKYMLSADVAISAAGVTSYELCAAGAPTITYTMADNQRMNARFFHENGLMEYAGDLRSDPVLDRVLKLLQGKYQETGYRREVSEAMKSAVDGKGAWRIADELCKMRREKGCFL